MANFIGLVFATLKNEGIDTKGMSTEEAVDKYNEIKGDKDGTPAEERKMKEPKSEKLNYDIIDKAEKYFVNTAGRNKKEIKGFKDTISYMNDMANAGMSYKEIDRRLSDFEVEIEVERRNLDNKENKTEADKQRQRELMDYQSGVNFASGQLWKAWKK